MTIEKRTSGETSAENASNPKAVGEPVVQTDAKEPTKKEIKETRRTDGQDVREYDPHYGAGGAFTINAKGQRVRVNDKGEEIGDE